jgi:hypothetical protein
LGLSCQLVDQWHRWLYAEELNEQQWQQVVTWVEQHGAAAAACMAASGSQQPAASAATTDAAAGTCTSSAAAGAASSFSYLAVDLQELQEQHACQVGLKAVLLTHAYRSTSANDSAGPGDHQDW